jgi:ribosomal protein S27E
MTGHFIKLKCANCGAKLDVYDDMERFACASCGTEIEVQRRGGTVVLKAAAEDSRKMNVGADKAAADLDLVRLKEEAQLLAQRREAMLAESADRKKWGYLAGIALVVIGYFLVRFGLGFVMGLGVLLAGFITISAIRRNGKKVVADVRQLEAKIQMLNHRIEDREKLAAR